MLKAWLTNKATQLFFVLWLHISLLNLFFVNKRGVVFLWQQNSELNTLLTHFITALIAAIIYIAITKIRIGLAEKKLTMGNNVFVVGSVVMVLLIGFFLFSSE
ncbi:MULTISPECIES: hypothetical protein [unclassified Colwellia]|mgnify:CR=1 FL=1|jgi:hypothetical protein|uniref:hypothetical protein n=1 Tax=unclassified Colwellia TaxID=196834 RepID=UPI0015F5C614|nr:MULTISPECIES: hypothetical protein [unclassified Colwellia]MBA6362347.1 hypothetical protein [Colwellia sp. BRX8-8]MBA6346825.1 hypothetical protein [Colwellia sp. BRX8-9]MBA6350461.1 hypothetical protein [Colwellia sp. BRX9-1]MBA6355438.1 hypothetical protein [Colwellia sp. BRX8-3]MBA6358784.1 hypothetical protein [Colwellia sp. BRX8-6]|tara:strand:- start:2268 stop:2576 length:309 start_codon:yes stop_codon:yes gene_type:complete